LFEKVNNETKCPSCSKKPVCVDCGNEIKARRSDAQRCSGCRRTHIISGASKRYYADKDKKRNYDAARREQKRYLYREALKRHREKYPEKKLAETNARRKRFRQATPPWANSFFIREAYELALLRTKITGIKWHVDHIVPLNGAQVCGLHLEKNIRVIPAQVNLKKTNKFSPEDIPEITCCKIA
jgi:hypothetical protein